VKPALESNTLYTYTKLIGKLVEYSE